jgi:IclR family KDG regulon transcriptional repressor
MSRRDYTLHTLVKGLVVLETLETASDGLTLTETAEHVGESATVVFRLIKTLEKRGYVQQVPESKRYTLGLRTWEMGAKAVSRIGLVEAARPVLRWLTGVTGQSAGLVIPRGPDVLYVDVAEGSEPLRFYADLGSRAPAYATASGKAILAHRPELVAAVIRGGMKRLTRSTITGARELHRRLAEIRRTGLSINRGERRDDIAAVAAPVFNAVGECVAAVTIAGPRTRFTEDDLEDFARHMRKASEEISVKLGHRARS